MNRLIASLLFVCATSLLAPQPASAVTIDWVPVGNPGNPADTVVMTQDGTTGYGSVPYSYQIDKYDVTNSQYVEFLNTKDPNGNNTLSLWNSQMADATNGGINFDNGNLPGSKYTLIAGRENHPVNWVTWYDTIRFANWLNNGQGSGNTETGAYTLGALGPGAVPTNGDSISRNVGATVFLPNENEWYKAAYYDPRTTAQGGPPLDSHYWPYPTSSSFAPIASPPTGLANHANYTANGNSPTNLTDVGAYTGTTSPYGAFDMGGNVFQWNEAFSIGNGTGSVRGLRGGSFNDPTFSARLLSSSRDFTFPVIANEEDGFRVASIPAPEPSSLVLAVFGFAGLAAWRWRRGKRSRA